MCTFDPDRASTSIAPNLDDAQRIEYLSREIEEIREVLEDESDCKWIYQALIECTVLVSKLQGMTDEAKWDMSNWLSELKRLDTLRMGRWNELDETFKA